MSLIPNRFLVRLEHPCRFHAAMPLDEGDELLALPPACRIDNFAALDARTNFADVRLAWNDLGIGVQMRVTGKDRPVAGDLERPRYADGITFWLDTRDARTGHRGTRYCHQFQFLATGGGEGRDEPIALQVPIHRALENAPLHPASAIPFRCVPSKGGYTIEAFLGVAVLNGFDPENHPRLGVSYLVHDGERGTQALSVGGEFPVAEDPSLWSVLRLVRSTT